VDSSCSKFPQLHKQYAYLYDQAFSQVPGLEVLETREYAESSYHLYVIALQLEQLTVTRDEFIDAIQSAGLEMYLKKNLLRQAVDTYPDFAELVCYHHWRNRYSNFAGYNEKLCLHNW
jgi:dTDP-4-amino-4,6-dideoxygalactose transaminase